MYHINTGPPPQRRGAFSLSTHTLSLEPIYAGASSHAGTHMDLRTRKEISRLVAMQLQLAEQLIIENRLRNLKLNAFPVLGTRSGSGLNTEKGSRTRITTKSLNHAPPAVTMFHASKAQQAHRKKRRRKSKSKAAFEWCPLAIQECSSTEILTSPPHNSPCRDPTPKQQVDTAGSPTSSTETGLSDLLGIGSLTTKHNIAHKQPPKPRVPTLTGERNQATENLTKKRNIDVEYFRRRKLAVDSSKPRKDHDASPPYRMCLSVVMPTLQQKWPCTEQRLRTKGYTDEFTTLCLPPLKFTTQFDIHLMS